MDVANSEFFDITAKCTANDGTNCTLTPRNEDLAVASTIVINGNKGLVVGRDYLVRIIKR